MKVAKRVDLNSPHHTHTHTHTHTKCGVLDDYEISFTIKQVKLGVVNILPVNTLLVFVCLKTAHEVREGKKL